MHGYKWPINCTRTRTAQLAAEKAGQTAQASRDGMAAKVAKARAEKTAAEERRLAQQQMSNSKEEEGAQDSAEVRCVWN